MNFLVEQYEIRGGGLYGKIYDVSISEGGPPKTRRILTTIGDSRVEMGLSFHGLCSGFTTNLEEEQCDLGHRGLTHKDSPLHSHEEHAYLRSVYTYLSR